MVPLERIWNIYPMLISTTYSVLLVILSFFIYFKTRDIFELSKNKSLEYFRRAFLFLGISNLLNLLTSFVPINFLSGDYSKILFDLDLFFSLLTIIYLTYSMFFHRFEKLSKNKYSPFILALLIIFVKGYFPRSRFLLLLFGLSLGLYFVFLFCVALFNYFNSSKKKKFKSIYLIYIVLFLSMFLSNLLEAFAIALPVLSSIIYLIAVFAFVFLFIRILKELVI
jgi:hypothetical protein